MKLTARLGLLCVALSLALLVANAAAAPKSISGKLSKRGYTVIALAADGKAKAVRARGRRFRLRPPAKRVTLHLRAPNGIYAGPIVVGRSKKGRRAIVGVRAGARLGPIKVRRGYATVTKRRARKFGDLRRLARARKGVPIGAGVFGWARSRPPRKPPPGDLDFDGVPSSLDIDDDGDLILDDLDRSPVRRAARAARQVVDSPFLSYALELTPTETVNVNAGFSDQQIEETTLTSTLMGGILSDRSPALRIGFPQPATTELDCGTDNPATPEREGLIYCSSGTPPSKGRIFPNGPTQPAAVFPDCCDSDQDGFGELRSLGLNTGVMDLHFTGTTADFKTGQVLIKQHVANGDPGQCPDESNPACVTFSSILRYVSATVPTLVSYSDTEGNAGTVQYPLPGSQFGPPAPPGTLPHLVAPGPDGNVIVTVSLWQPQRRPTSDSECVQPPQEMCTSKEWIDIGGLTYSSTVTTGPHVAPFQSRRCPQDAYIIPTGQPLIKAPPVGSDANRGLTHTLPDRPANPGNKITYALNLTMCLAGLPWGPGQSTSVEFRASGQPQGPGIEAGHASQINVAFKRRGGRLTVRKQTEPAESPTSGTEFGFQFAPNTPIADINFKLRHDGASTFEFPPGTYTVDELVAPGYSLTGVACDDPTGDSTGTIADRRATFSVALHEHVTCTFTNTKL